MGYNVLDARLNVIAWFRLKNEAEQYCKDYGALLRVQEARRGPA